jgi:phosphopantothenoylcysteine decarboxylase/phosphopantothenate--cysteine ligase
MRFLVTLGPTYESLDEVRRLTNFSTGSLGTELANSFTADGHEVTALRGYYAICTTPLRAAEVKPFTTTDHLLELFREQAARHYDAIFHAAAVSDFKFGGIFERSPDGSLSALKAGKVSTRSGTLMAELVPTAKIIAQLRNLFPGAKLFGWKYEVDGDQAAAVRAGQRQLADNRTDYSVVNGRAYGAGFGVLSRTGVIDHCPDSAALCKRLLRLALAA